MSADLLHIAVLALLVVSGFYAIWSRDMLSSVIALGGLSLVLSVEFYILQAPDVAIAEAAIGAGLSTAIYVIALKGCGRLGRRKKEDDPR